ncbi:aminotransferase class I/II-fold pyridoxal phosphate-dependent enzyme [Maribacter sp. 2-571]|uniref:aminotransferase class I/II-fold pyridoxal phosphate-dependent enzyme n=1 Tax=Maribacter sp. 2-571 TaxID=3417569 RepID=UPI003D34B36E
MTYYIDSFPGRQLPINDVAYRYFGGTAYLGLQMDRSFQDLFIKNIRIHGTNYGASRKSNIRLNVFDEAENYLAALVGSEACLTMSSGYLVGQLLAHQLSAKRYCPFYAPGTHSALLSDTVSRATSYPELRLRLEHHLKTSPERAPVLFLDAIDFFGENYPDFLGLRELPLKELIVVIDDSHGLGIVGEHGSGVYKTVRGFGPKELMVCGSLGKGFGIQAGAIFGSKKRIAAIQNSAFYGGASPCAPAALATLLEAENIYAHKRTVLQEHIALFRSKLDCPERFASMPQHPAFSYTGKVLTDHLRSRQIITTSFNYPEGSAALMNRIVLSAGHTKADIHALIEGINSL